MIEMTCKNHPRARYLTKGPDRLLHFVEADPDYVRKMHPELAHHPDNVLRHHHEECLCPISDLIVTKEDADA